MDQKSTIESAENWIGLSDKSSQTRADNVLVRHVRGEAFVNAVGAFFEMQMTVAQEEDEEGRRVEEEEAEMRNRSSSRDRSRGGTIRETKGDCCKTMAADGLKYLRATTTGRRQLATS